ncbi:MAG TPA: ABC transporter substrate-binding protein, partial [Lachnospiraceae bacterium]|nr:ABC transporter substrate-binding protein [Lachnospiraceae bacterium]
AAAGQKVGVSMPTKDLQRWNQDGANMEKELKDAGYEVDLQFANNDVQTQLSQVENMISGGCNVLVIAAIEGSSLGEALDMAKEANIPVIAYDRLLMDSDAVSYYATFDNYKVGTVQGTYVKDTLDLDNAEGPFNIEFTAGDPGDNNAGFFFNGAYDVLKPYIDEGKLVVQSGKTTFNDVATPEWKTETAQSEAENRISSFYTDKDIDVWLCSNDSTALGVENALAANYKGKYPIITGQDCDIENTKNMIAGKQSMSVFKDTRTLASQVVKMVGQILAGEKVDVNDEKTYNNNVITVPSYLCEPVFADANNYKEILLDSGYYTEDQLK